MVTGASIVAVTIVTRGSVVVVAGTGTTMTEGRTSWTVVAHAIDTCALRTGAGHEALIAERVVVTKARRI